MPAIVKQGSKTIAYKAQRGTVLTSGDLTAATWYEVKSVGDTTALPTGMSVGSVFKSPASGSAITLAAGDEVYPLTLVRMFKTDAEISAEEGTIDVTDDSVSGYSASILDGYRTISGSLNGFAKVDDATGELTSDTSEILGRFFDTITDDSAGVYTFKATENEKFLLFYCLNKDAPSGGVQNWLIIPILLSSLGTGAGLKDAQKRDLSWTKAEGPASLYRRTVGAGDEL